ncbi:E3 ubiquitin-protein ligase TRIM32 [Bagarius yarrelli]|uniref:E3 ubiquitin-protein ligase TRIM32 n=1 Tax=Bagarius yarrelli TaxID=175774 RepID=A0A556TKN0_BAGYA|nr:E3 ubiquitin-protein ligase TRIM32 [Bagarius yarrelli]
MMLLGSHFNSTSTLGTISQQVYSTSEPLNSQPSWITQALYDLEQGEKELHRLTEKQTAEVDEVNQSLDSAIFNAQKEERHLLEKVEKAHREAQQKLQQLKRENAAAARVGQSLVDGQLRKLGQFKEQIFRWGRCPTGPNKSQLLRGVKELLQPWEISLSLKKVNFHASAESNVIQFGEINVQEHSMTFPIGVCGTQGQKCALHTGQITFDNHVAVTEQLCAPCNSGKEKQLSKANSGSTRVVRKIRLSKGEDDVLGQKRTTPSPKTYKVWPRKQNNSESSQDEDSDFLGSDSHGEDLFLAIDSVSSQGELEAESPVSEQCEINSHSFPKSRCKQRVLVPVSSQEPSCPPEESRPEYCGQNCGFYREITSPVTYFSGPKLSYSCVDLSYGHSFGGPRRSPSPADSIDSSYTYTVRSASGHSGPFTENQDLIFTTNLSAKGHQLKYGKDKNQKKLNQNNLSRPQGQNLKRSETLDFKKQHLKDNCKGCRQVSRSLSMSEIEGSGKGTIAEHNRDRSKKDRRGTGLPKVMEKGRTLRVGLLVKKFGKQGSGRTDFTLPSGIHATAQGQLFIVDCGNVRVQVTDLQKNIVQQVTLPAVDSTSRHCRNFFDVAANSKGLIALTCAAERAVLVFNRHGRLLQTFGSSGTQQDFEAPRGITVTWKDEFLVADIRRGTLTSLKLDPKTGTKIERTVVTGFYRPYLVAACLTTGLMAVSERGNETGRAACIRVLEPGWNTIHTLGVCSGMGPVLTSPWGICIDSDGNVLVADWGKQHRVLLYPAGGVGWDIVSQGLNSPRGLALLPEGHLVVSDSMNHCIKIYRYK